MKWVNRDINDVEWATIPKLSALDGLVTPPRLLELFFATYLLIWFFAVSSCTVEKAGINFEITNENICLFLSMLLLTGYHKLPDHEILLCKQGLIQCLVIRSNLFSRIFIFVITNNLINKLDKFSKPIPVNNKLNRRFLKFSFNRYNKTIMWFPVKGLMAVGNEQTTSRFKWNIKSI